jgi:ribosomal protein L24
MEHNSKLPVKKGDTVKVIAGKELGKTGKILKVDYRSSAWLLKR